MTHRWPFLWLTLALLCGAFLFQTSQKVTEAKERLHVLAVETEKESEALRVLAAEWSYLNQPMRLEALARKKLPLAPIKGRQLATAATLDQKLIQSPSADRITVNTKPAPEKKAEKIPLKPSPLPSPKTPPPSRAFHDVIKTLGVTP